MSLRNICQFRLCLWEERNPSAIWRKLFCGNFLINIKTASSEMLETVIRILLSRYHSNWQNVHFLMYKHTLLIGNGFGSRQRLLSLRVRAALESPFNNQLHTESHQSPLSGMSLNCLLLFLIGLTVYYFSTKMLFCQGLIFKAVNWRRDSSAALYKRITGERIYRHNRSIS